MVPYLKTIPIQVFLLFPSCFTLHFTDTLYIFQEFILRNFIFVIIKEVFSVRSLILVYMKANDYVNILPSYQTPIFL